MVDLAELVASAQPPGRAVREAARLTLDSLACIAGGAQTAIGAAARTVAVGHGPGGEGSGRRAGWTVAAACRGSSGLATVAGSDAPASAIAAAAANARMGHALDADDTFMMLHFGMPTVVAALAVVEARSGSGQQALEATAVGFEAAARVLRAFGPLVALADGKVSGYARPLWAPVPLVFGAAAAAARAIGLAPRQVEHAFSIAAANTPLPVAHKWAEHSDGRPLGTYKYVDAGHCAAVGVEAALLAEAGLTGITGLFEGSDSFWHLSGRAAPDLRALAAPLRERWQIEDTSYKPWPSCRWLHYPVTALASVLEREQVDASDVERIIVRAPAMGTARQHVDREPAGWVAAEFSHPHSIAMLLLGVPPGVEWYARDTMARPDVRRLRSRVAVEVHPESERLDGCLDDGHFTSLPGAVEVVEGGRRLAAAVTRAKGDPWDPATRLTDGDLTSKLEVMVGHSSAVDAKELAREVLELASAPRLASAPGLATIARSLRSMAATDRTGPAV